MVLRLGRQMESDAMALARYLRRWAKSINVRLVEALEQSGVAWQVEAIKRVPEDTGDLAAGIESNVYTAPAGYVLEVGTNVTKDGVCYAVYVEWGTDIIASGRVKALGDGPYITDAQAIHTWLAKELRGATKPAEQMPWLRPSFVAIYPELLVRLNKAVNPPRKRSRHGSG